LSQIDIRAGRVLFPSGTPANQATVGGTITVCPIDLPVGVTIDRLILNVAGAAAGGATPLNAQVGIYTGLPGGGAGRCLARADIVGTALAVAGNVNVDVPHTMLPRGRLWLAVFAPTFATTQPQLRSINLNTAPPLDLNSLADGAALDPQPLQTRYTGFTSLPDSLEDAVPTFVVNTSSPFLGLRVVAVGVAGNVNGTQAASISPVATPGAPVLPASFPGVPSALPTSLPTVIG